MPGFETILSVIFVVAGAGLTLAAVRQLLQRRAFLRDFERVTGAVVKLEERASSDDGPSYFPVVRFTTAAGRDVTFTSQLGSGEGMVRVGDPMQVRHRRDRPEIAEVDSVMALWGQTLVFGVLGVVFLVVGCGILLGWLPVRQPLRDKDRREPVNL